eukprot:6210820-Pleurochrysis_carterae.AAC.1
MGFSTRQTRGRPSAPMVGGDKVPPTQLHAGAITTIVPTELALLSASTPQTASRRRSRYDNTASLRSSQSTVA